MESAVLMANRGLQSVLGATDSGLRLSDYPLSSQRSRGATRAILEARKAALGEGTLIRIVAAERGDDVDLSKCTCPMPIAGAVGVCKCFL